MRAGQLLMSSRQASSNASEGGVNRESSLDDSGVVDDHDDQDNTDNIQSSVAVPPASLQLASIEVPVLTRLILYLLRIKTFKHTQFYTTQSQFYFFHSQSQTQRELTPVTLALSPREVRIIKCNGNVAKLKKHDVYALHPEYLSQIVLLGKCTLLFSCLC